MRLGDVLETRLLELAVHIGREDADAAGRPEFAQQAETAVGQRLAVQVQPVAVEPPGQLGVLGEVTRVGDLLEPQAEPRVRRVRAPEPFAAPEVRQPGVDAHPGAGADQERAGAVEQLRGAGEVTTRLRAEDDLELQQAGTARHGLGPLPECAAAAAPPVAQAW